jgi:Tol biopolymer transport system component
MRIRFALLTLLLSAALAPGARASYPGHVGTIAWADLYSTFDPLNNGAVTFTDTLYGLPAGGAPPAAELSCQGGDTGFVGSVQFCPESVPGFSPDGQTLVMAGVEYQPDGSSMPDQHGCSGISSCPKALIVAGADGSSPRLVPVALANVDDPAFLPDGGHLVFSGQVRPSGVTDIYTAASDGSALTRLIGGGASDPAPCPDGSILYVHGGNVYLLPVGDGHPMRLTSRGGASFPDCSHDGRAVVFLRRAALYTMTITGRHVRRLTGRGVVYGRPAFSPAGGLVAISTVRRCTSMCGGRFPYCTNLTDRIEVLDLEGRRRQSYVVGRNYCSSDGDLGGDSILGVGWEPLP